MSTAHDHRDIAAAWLGVALAAHTRDTTRDLTRESAVWMLRMNSNASWCMPLLLSALSRQSASWSAMWPPGVAVVDPTQLAASVDAEFTCHGAHPAAKTSLKRICVRARAPTAGGMAISSRSCWRHGDRPGTLQSIASLRAQLLRHGHALCDTLPLTPHRRPATLPRCARLRLGARLVVPCVVVHIAGAAAPSKHNSRSTPNALSPTQVKVTKSPERAHPVRRALLRRHERRSYPSSQRPLSPKLRHLCRK